MLLLLCLVGFVSFAYFRGIAAAVHLTICGAVAGIIVGATVTLLRALLH